MAPVTFLPQPVHADAIGILEERGSVLRGYGEDAVTIEEAAGSVHAILTRAHPVRAEVIAAAPALAVIGRAGVGVDTIDVDAATQRGIPVAITPRANYRAVAEHAVALLLTQYKHIAHLDTAVREGRFAEREVRTGRETRGRTLGVLGLGRIGSEVARMALGGLGMTVLGHTRRPDAVAVEGLELVAGVDELLARSDVLSVHVPLTPDTRGLLGARELALLPEGAVLVNTSRAQVVDEAALAEALLEGRLGGACLDVFADEPPRPDNPLLSAPRTVLTPHSAAFTEEAIRQMGVDAAEAVVAVLEGRRPAPDCVVNPQALDLAGL